MFRALLDNTLRYLSHKQYNKYPRIPHVLRSIKWLLTTRPAESVAMVTLAEIICIGVVSNLVYERNFHSANQAKLWNNKSKERDQRLTQIQEEKMYCHL